MSQQDGGRRPQWSGRRGDSSDDPELPNERELERDLGPSRTPMQEMRDYDFFGPDDDLPDEPLERAEEPRRIERPTNYVPPDVNPAAAAVAASSARRGLAIGGLSEERILLLIVAFFAVGGLGLIVTGFLLGRIAGGLLVLVGLATLVATGAGFWWERQGRQAREG